MNNYDNIFYPTMPEHERISLLKTLLQQENESFFNHSEHAIFMLDYYRYAKNMLAEQINGFTTFAEIETFINLSRRMSLNEWIESL